MSRDARVCACSDAELIVERGTFSELVIVRVEKWAAELGDQQIKDVGGEMDVSQHYCPSRT